ncbi:class F sortase [Actinophytocola sp.]|uniref:class F sortase n=1 Tax=Actinophytocola sp. TaxID=1872138 RepID=UPI002D801587|nr:class F sortase [Actinophytocola sp.]HET9139163.1 class F sortase [Actinophytocola sp.]
MSRTRVLITVCGTGLLVAGAAGWLITTAEPAPPPSFGAPQTTALRGTPPVPTAAPTSARRGEPVRTLALPAQGLTVPVVAVGVAPDGSMAIPDDVGTAGWYRFGAAPGSDRGSIVISGHINDRDQGPGAFAGLNLVNPGDPVTVVTDTGRTLRYQVVSRQRFDKADVPLDRVFDRTGPPRLTLVTCGGAFDRGTGNYRDNIVVTAVPRSP